MKLTNLNKLFWQEEEITKRDLLWNDTLPIPAESHFDSLTVLSIAPLFARAIRAVFSDGSVTDLFGGVA